MHVSRCIYGEANLLACQRWLWWRRGGRFEAGLGASLRTWPSSRWWPRKPSHRMPTYKGCMVIYAFLTTHDLPQLACAHLHSSFHLRPYSLSLSLGQYGITHQCLPHLKFVFVYKLGSQSGGGQPRECTVAYVHAEVHARKKRHGRRQLAYSSSCQVFFFSPSLSTVYAKSYKYVFLLITRCTGYFARLTNSRF